MAFLDRLREVTQAKALEPREFHQRTGLPYDQISRVGTGPRGPSALKLRDLVVGLEVDANFLLEATSRYEGMSALQAVAEMSLDRFLVERGVAGAPISAIMEAHLHRVAQNSQHPPIWVEEWAKHADRIAVAQVVRETDQPEHRARNVRRSRRLTP